MVDVIVIGSGAAGMIAAGRAAERGRSVLLLEKNRVLGKKLSITGGGRCNITNAQENIQTLLGNYGNAKKFLFSSFTQFGVSQTFTFFEQRGLPLVVRANHRAFPQTEKASDVVRVLREYMAHGNVVVKTGVNVGKILTTKNMISGVAVDGEILTATSYVVATGGNSHPETGSTGDGWRWLQDIGHTVANPTPSVVPIAVSDHWVRSLAGTSLDGVKITFFVDGKKKLHITGRVLCTHFGLSGPLILNSAAKIADLLQEGEVTGTVDVFPKLDVGATGRHVMSIFEQNKNKTLGNTLKFIVPAGTAKAMLSLLPNFDAETKIHSVSKEQRKELSVLLKTLPLHVLGLMGLDRAVVVDGGVVLDEVDGKTFRSRKFNNLFLVGDILHVNRPSGGYSLQLCWTSGWVAGSAA